MDQKFGMDWVNVAVTPPSTSVTTAGNARAIAGVFFANEVDIPPAAACRIVLRSLISIRQHLLRDNRRE